MRNDKYIFGRGATMTLRILPCCLLIALLAGCARRYDIVMTDGSRVTNVSKPVLDRQSGVFTYKDVRGQEHKKSAGRVVEIAPHTDKPKPPGLD